MESIATVIVYSVILLTWVCHKIGAQWKGAGAAWFMAAILDTVIALAICSIFWK